MDNQPTIPELILTLDRQDLSFYTTLLQSGVEIKGSEGETMAIFLDRLPGFTLDYISDVVQTIFLNGTAVDDLTTPLKGKNPVLALSAAMPGLAGAIFRRNSFHAGLRTQPDKEVSKEIKNRPLTVTLKLFNSIALERGPELLQIGVSITSRLFIDFLGKRKTLLEKIKQVSLANTIVNKNDLTALLTDIKKIKLKISTTHG
ncbi:MAG: hypothetical protein BA862_05450 [Desulfobulbaceae bacterium S3730MH12]|nr:MAG: hypothetical protein BA862_05450 [Desulfobulbaceae bacterium S3730MH12]OEU78746.1 MAG: hypothetical protein BA873_03220 [Desulfobulbaceae bacterium C00003063]